MTWGWVNYDISFIPWNKFGMARFLHKAHSPALLPGILVRCCTEGSCRRPLHCEAGYCLLDSIPSSGHRCLEAPHSPGTAWEPSWSRCRPPPPCQEDLPTRSPRQCRPSKKPIFPRAPSVLWAMGLRCRVNPFFLMKTFLEQSLELRACWKDFIWGQKKIKVTPNLCLTIILWFHTLSINTGM